MSKRPDLSQLLDADRGSMLVTLDAMIECGEFSVAELENEMEATVIAMKALIAFAREARA